MDRAVLPPGPDLLGHERHGRRKQAEHRGQPEAQGALGGRDGLRAVVAVGPWLHQFQIVVAEESEEPLGVLQCPAPQNRHTDTPSAAQGLKPCSR